MSIDSKNQYQLSRNWHLKPTSARSGNRLSGDQRMRPIDNQGPGQNENFSGGQSENLPSWAVLGWEKQYLRGELMEEWMAKDMLVYLVLRFEEKHGEIRNLLWNLYSASYDFSSISLILVNKYEEMEPQILAARKDRIRRIREGDETVVPETLWEAYFMREVKETNELKERGKAEAKAKIAAFKAECAAYEEKCIERDKDRVERDKKISALNEQIDQLNKEGTYGEKVVELHDQIIAILHEWYEKYHQNDMHLSQQSDIESMERDFSEKFRCELDEFGRKPDEELYREWEIESKRFKEDLCMIADNIREQKARIDTELEESMFAEQIKMAQLESEALARAAKIRADAEQRRRQNDEKKSAEEGQSVVPLAASLKEKGRKFFAPFFSGASSKK
ncbi:MAG: hypothetical protein LBI69_00215 [Puniceicoccales bacterium]|jgi:hypothetical protein|nr:hypothetical protein [Puniceicoccales bacterium]